MEKLLEIKSLNVGFLMGNQQVQVLNQVSFDIYEKKFWPLSGRPDAANR
ncbi:MAG: hypothetical protein ACLSFZ_01825 [Frisingicoccus sp.]